MSDISESNAVISPTLHHINLKTGRLQEMIDWYSAVVGMKATYQFTGGARLTNEMPIHHPSLMPPRHAECP